MKYKPEDYIDSGIYGIDEDIQSQTEKVVKCRKPHECSSCQKQIEVGEYALSQKGFMDGMPVGCHTCLPCIDKWLEESGQVDMDDETVEESEVQDAK